MVRIFSFMIILLLLFGFATDSKLLAQQRPGPPPAPGTEIELGRFPVDTSPHGLKIIKGYVTGVYPIKK